MDFDSKKNTCFNQELLIQTIQKKVNLYYKKLTFKGVSVAHIMSVYAYWKATTHSKIAQDSDDENTISIANFVVDDILRRNSLRGARLFSKIKKDIRLWLNSFTKKTNFSIQLEYLISIETNKYYSFVLPLAKSLSKKGHKVGFLLYPEVEVETYQDFTYIDYESNKTTSFPKFWSHVYRNAYYSYQLIEYTYNIYKKLNFPKSILVEGDNHTQITVGYLSKRYSFESICLQWGYAGGTSVYKLGWRNMPYHKFLSWGDFFSNSFKRHNKNLDIISFGHPLLSKSENLSTDEKNVILFAVPKEMLPYIAKQDILYFLKKASDFCNENSEYIIRFRTHPNFSFDSDVFQNLKNKTHVEFHDYFTHSLEESFSHVKYCISVGSTISLESMNFNCIPLFMQTNDIPLLAYSELKSFLTYPFVIKKKNSVKEVLTELDNQHISVIDFKEHFFKNKNEELELFM